MYTEDELLPISALQHLLFCERQCALIHIEQSWDENRLTAEGRILHERVHEQESESRGDVRIARGVRLRSLRLGLIGMADVVEFHRGAAANLKSQISDIKSQWTPLPVEYKRGRPKPDSCDKVQLCAQAMCLEEMLGCAIAEGAIFYGVPRRREGVAFDSGLRSKTERAATRLHELVASTVTPPARYEKKCRNCSLFSICMPKAMQTRSAKRFLEDALSAAT